MKQKTAIMELIEKLQDGIDQHPHDQLHTVKAILHIKLCIGYAQQLLEKEKEQIIDAFIESVKTHYNNPEVWTPYYVTKEEEAEQYYNQTYLKESK